MEYIREHKKGLVGTVVFHGVILLLLILMGFFTPLPLPGEEGILVNFGDSETGWGEEVQLKPQARPAGAPWESANTL